MLAAKVRSGLIETHHDGAVAVMSADGEVIARSGDIDRPFFLRSAAKPFQAAVSLEEGAELAPVELALGCASHVGSPAHVAIVGSVLASAGLGPDALLCPPAWPQSDNAVNQLIAAGHKSARRIWHNCSGKHSAWLKACVARGWSTETYLQPGHPLQDHIIKLVSELGEFSVEPVGIDGCGAPVMRGTARSLGLLYARLATMPELREILEVMHRYPALVSGVGMGDASIATVVNAAAKRGAAGCLGVAHAGHLGIGVKAWDGNQAVADLAAIAALDQLGFMTSFGRTSLERLARPAVFGGGRPVGNLEPRLELKWE